MDRDWRGKSVAEQKGKVWTLNAGAGTKNLFMDFPTYAYSNYQADATFLKASDVPVKILWTAPVSGGHNGATVQFGPVGYLYLTPPVWATPHLDPENKWLNSATGGLVYRANPASKFYGVYLFADFCSYQMIGLTQTNRKMTEVKAPRSSH